MALFAVGSLLVMYVDASNPPPVAPLVQGAGAGLIGGFGAVEFIRAMFDERQWPLAVAVYAGMAGLGLILGPFAGAAMVEGVGWRGVFALEVAVVMLALLGTTAFVPESRAGAAAGSPDLIGTGLWMVSLGFALSCVSKSESDGWSIGTLLYGAVAAALLGALIVHLIRSARHWLVCVLPRWLLTNRRFMAATFADGTLIFVLFGTAFGVTFYLQSVRGYSPLEGGIALLPIPLGIIGGAVVANWMMSRWAPPTVVTVSVGAVAAAAMLLANVTVESGYWLPTGIALSAAGLAAGAGLEATREWIVTSISLEETPAANQFHSLMKWSMGALGIVVPAALIGSSYRDRVVRLANDSGLPPIIAEAVGENVTRGDAFTHGWPTSFEPTISIVRRAVHEAYVGAFGNTMWILAIGVAIGLVGACVYFAHKRPAEGFESRTA
jgi:MFS transporter, DHA2 family, multidrug resistance protein